NDGGDGFGGDVALESIFEMVSECFGGRLAFGAIFVGEGYAVNVAREGLKSCFIRMSFARQRHRHQRAAMESILEADDRGALRVPAGDLHGVFNSFGASVEKNCFLCEVSRRERVQFLCDGDIAFVRSDGKADMQMLVELFANRGSDARRLVADVEA